MKSITFLICFSVFIGNISGQKKKSENNVQFEETMKMALEMYNDSMSVAGLNKDQVIIEKNWKTLNIKKTEAKELLKDIKSSKVLLVKYNKPCPQCESTREMVKKGLSDQERYLHNNFERLEQQLNEMFEGYKYKKKIISSEELIQYKGDKTYKYIIYTPGALNVYTTPTISNSKTYVVPTNTTISYGNGSVGYKKKLQWLIYNTHDGTVYTILTTNWQDGTNADLKEIFKTMK